MNETMPYPAPTPQYLSWRRPPLTTLSVLLIAIVEAWHLTNNPWMGLQIMAATVVGFAPLLGFIHNGRNRWTKQWITALFLLPWLGMVTRPIWDTAANASHRCWFELSTIFWSTFSLSLLLLIFPFLAYRVWRKVHRWKTNTIDASRQEFDS